MPQPRRLIPMPLIANSNLPTFARLKGEGQEVLTSERASTQDIRELHIGLLNLMPDAALEATERQFLRLIGACNRIAQFHVHPFSFPQIPRNAAAARHIKQYYRPFAELQNEGLDALIISGANPAQPDLADEPFWAPLLEVIDWAGQSVCSVMCSCLATHAVVRELWGIQRYLLPQKRWGVYSHKVLEPRHPLTANINTRFDAPHSHLYAIDAEQCRDKGLAVLADSEQGGLHLATSPDGLRFVLFQGHPEYDAISLLKEYRREITRFMQGERGYPPPPENYFLDAAQVSIAEFKRKMEQCGCDYRRPPEFPESDIAKQVDNTWLDTGKAITNNWLGLIYQVANPAKRGAFMADIAPDNPLGLAPAAAGRQVMTKL